ncbi:nitroreductase family protein [Variovorax sp. H27-G14]|uniref:nitroreductase family protein n=1 Tax=Variovorax sp. H27-G14 TaxID=3111914 RepID=UPI0038FCAF13
MVTSQFRCLVALGETLHLERAAQASEVSPRELLEAIRALEAEYGHPLIEAGPRFEGFTPQGEQVLAWARSFLQDSADLHHALQSSRQESAIAPLLERRSVSPKRLHAPGPDAEHIDLILQAALRAPDHGGLHPWRVLEFREGQRAALADRFEQEKRRRDPLASPADLRRAREHATRPPVLLAFVVVPRARSKVPAREQWLAAGAALGNLLNAAHQLGFGAIMLSGERCFDPLLSAELGIKADEFLAGFVSLGSVAEAPPPRNHALPGQVWSAWTAPVHSQAPSPPSPFFPHAPFFPQAHPLADPLNLDIDNDKR